LSHGRIACRVVLAAVLVASMVVVAPVAGGEIGTQTADGATTILHDGDRLTVANTTGQSVYGRTDRQPGSTLTVMLRSSGASPFLMSTTATVTESGRFRATFDLSPVAPGSEFTARVSANGTELATARGVVQPCDGDCPAPAQATPSATLEPAENLTLAAGMGQAIRGRSNLPPGNRVTVRFQGTDGRLPPLETEAVVDDRGRFVAVADLSGVPTGADIRLSVDYEGARLTERRVRVAGCDGPCRSGRESTAPNATMFTGRNGTTSPRVIETVQGRRVRLPLSLGDAERATLSIGGPAGSYALDAVVRDGDDDGRVTLVFDTANASYADRAVRSVGDADVATVRHAPDREARALDAGEYPLVLYRGTDTDRLVGLLVVRPRADGGSGEATATRFTFRRSPLTTEKGRTTQVPVTLDEAEAATIVVNGSDYALRATVRDGSGDERVTLRLNTSTGADPRVTTVEEADAVTLHAEEESVDPGEYRLALYRGANVTRDGQASPDLWSASGTLVVSEAASTPSPGSRTPVGGLSLPALGALGLGGLLAVAGLALLTGAVEP
jgi:hypothetical protein